MLFYKNKKVTNERAQNHSSYVDLLKYYLNSKYKSDKTLKTNLLKWFNNYQQKYGYILATSYQNMLDNWLYRDDNRSNTAFIKRAIAEVERLKNISKNDQEKNRAKFNIIEFDQNAAKGVTTNTTKADKEDIINATINVETDTTSLSSDLINKLKSLSSASTDKVKLLDPLKVSGEVEAEFVSGSLTKDSFYHGGKFDYAINVLTILLRGGKIRKFDSSKKEEEFTSLWSANSSIKASLASLLNAVVDYKLNNINDNSRDSIYNEFMENPKDNGVKIFEKVTGISFAKICKSCQVKGDLNGAIADKVLGPQKLNLLEKDGYTFSEFRKAVIAGIKARTGEGSSQKINSELAKSLIAMVNKVADETKESDVSIEDLLFEKQISNKKISFKYNLDSGEINKVETQKVLNRIMNDFGEVLGPLFLLKYLQGSERVIFGSDYSEAMKDYTIVHNNVAIGVSAKSIKGGNAPDIKPVLDILGDFINSGTSMSTLVDGQESSITFDQLLASKYVNNADKIAEAKSFFQMLVNAAKSTGESTLTQQQLLTLVDYLCGKEPYVKKLCSAMRIPSLLYFVEHGFKNNNVCDAFFEEKSYTELKSIFDGITAGTGSGDRKGFPAEKDFSKLSNKLKLGYFISPLIHAATDKANELFGLNKKNKNQIDIISAVIRLAFDYKQIYLGVDCDDTSFTITMQFNQMNVGNWKFATKAMMTDPWKQGILMTMTH